MSESQKGDMLDSASFNMLTSIGWVVANVVSKEASLIHFPREVKLAILIGGRGRATVEAIKAYNYSINTECVHLRLYCLYTLLKRACWQ